MARVKREIVAGLPLKDKISIRWKEYSTPKKERLNSFIEKNSFLIEKIVNYLGTASLISFSLTIWLVLRGSGEWFWFFPISLSISTILPIIEHYYKWFRKDWSNQE